jgi:Glycosyltransferase family 87
MATTLHRLAAKPRYDLADISIAMLTGVVLSFAAIFLCSIPFIKAMNASRDFVAYYASGYQLVHHADPYDVEAIRRIEHSAGVTVNGFLLMRNTPWALPLAFPLGLLNVRIAALLWSLVLVACLLVPVRLIRKMHGSPPNYIHWLSLAFPPALICLTMGQTSLYALLGLTLFLYYHQTRPFMAGVSLWLCSIKPHLLLPFAAALIGWILVSRSYKLLAGAAVALSGSFLLTFWIDPSAFSRYLELMRSPGVVQEFVPTLSEVLRFTVNEKAVWLQYLPTAIACLWALWFYWRRRHRWNWLEDGSLVILISFIAAPYSYIYDLTVAIPAVLHGAFICRKRYFLVLLVCFLAIIEVQEAFAKVTSLYYVWAGPVLLIWYLLARRSATGRITDEVPVALPGL